MVRSLRLMRITADLSSRILADYLHNSYTQQKQRGKLWQQQVKYLRTR